MSNLPRGRSSFLISPGSGTRLGKSRNTMIDVIQLGVKMPEPPVRTAAARTVAVHALTVRGTGVAWGEGGAEPVTRRTDLQCTCPGGMPAFPACTRVMFA